MNEQIRDVPSDDYFNDLAKIAFQEHVGRPHPWEGVQHWVICAMRDAYIAGRKANSVDQELRADLDEALRMLAEWAIAVRDSGTAWDYWDEHYKNVMYNHGPLRQKLDKVIADVFASEGGGHE